MPRKSFLVLAALLIVLPQRDTTAQATAILGGAAVLGGAAAVNLLSRCCADIRVGSEVRVSPRRASEFRGTVTTLDADSMTITTLGGTSRWARGDFANVRVNTRKEAKWAQGWLGGLAFGSVAGAFLGLVATDEDGWFSSPSENAMLGAIAFGLIGSTVGAVGGLFVTGDRWEHAAKPASPTASAIQRMSPTPIVKRSAFKTTMVGMQVRF